MTKNDSRNEMLFYDDSRGSQWNKWDLHVHTPASVVQYYGDSQSDETWDDYIHALEALPSDIKVVGVNDYFFLDGYRRLVTAKKSGRPGSGTS